MDVFSIVSLRHEKTNIEVSKQLWQKLSCTVTEESQTTEISDLESRGIVLSI